MAFKGEPRFGWDPQNGFATCILSDGKNTFVGQAECAEEDMDMISEKTGCTIALMRAEIEYYIHVRDNEILPALKALKQLYYSMNRSKHFNEFSYENKMLRRQIHQKETDLAVIKQMLNDEKQELKTMIEEKDYFYKRVRANRSAQADSVGQN